jgi:isoleucyl-tRNA synthetase
MPGYDPVRIEKEMLALWEAKKVFGQLRQKNSGGKPWSFLDGPMTANNPMGVHHAWGRTYKDLYQRFKAMNGHELRYQNGFDCHGLWVEVEVEKERGFKTKKDIEKFGLDNFSKACRARVEKYSKIQAEQSKRLGQWMDWDNSYYTMSDSNIEHIWHFLKACHEKGWLERKTALRPWCYRCGTSLSKHELSDEGWAELTHPGVFVKYPIEGKDKEYLLVWTTTSWTLPANVSVAVNQNIRYVKVKHNGEMLWLAKACLKVLKGGYEIMEEIGGADMVGVAYRNGFESLEAQKGVPHTVLEWELATEEEGTGMVHVAPGCGDVDFELGEKLGLAKLAPLDEEGNYIDGYGWLKGKHAKKVHDDVVNHLKKLGMIYKVEPYRHRYPVCWRCKEELVFRLSSEWFIKVDEIRPLMQKAVRGVKWQPEHVGKLMEDWLLNMGDWCISRKRFWGLPLMFYECGKCHSFEVIGSMKELKEKAANKAAVDKLPEPHRPWIDEIRVKCSKCGKELRRVQEVGDCWLDAGIVPFSTVNWLDDREYWKKWFPFEFITEMRAQVRLWFYAILFMSVALDGRSPYKQVLCNEEVRDEKGSPMHKSSGNAIWFDDAVEKIGADPMRWLYISQAPSQNLRFGFTVGAETRRKLNVIYNLTEYVKTYLELNDFKKPGLPRKLEHVLNRWFVSRVEQVKSKVTHYLDSLEPHKAHRELEELLLNDFSRFYVHLVRDKLKKDYSGKDKEEILQVMYYAMLESLKMMAPFIPFTAEKAYQGLFRKFEGEDSVHLLVWPDVNKGLEDRDLEKHMDIAKSVIEAASTARQEAGLKLRWPLEYLELDVKDDCRKAVKELEGVVKDLANVKAVKFGKAAKGTEFFHGKLKLGPVLEDEALLNELVRKTQMLRKESKLMIADRIVAYFHTDARTEKLLKKNGDRLKAGIGADAVFFGKEARHRKGELSHGKVKVSIGFEKA